MKNDRKAISENLDQLAELLRETPAERVRLTLRKDKRINLRCTSVEKDEIERTARGLKLTVTEYLLKCHAVIFDKIKP